MQIKDKAIVLQCIKYADKKHIIKLFTLNHGIITCLARISNSSSSKIKASTLMPLNLIDVEINIKENKEIQILNEANCFYIYSNIHNNFKKLSVVQFINEVLTKTLKEQVGNSELFQFITKSLIQLNETTSSVTNFHLHFLLELLKHFGIDPNNNFNSNNKYFDCREGRFSPIQLGFPIGLNEEYSELLSRAISSEIKTDKLSSIQRHDLLEGILAYYKFHIPGFTDLKCLEVLKEISLA